MKDLFTKAGVLAAVFMTGGCATAPPEDRVVREEPLSDCWVKVVHEKGPDTVRRDEECFELETQRQERLVQKKVAADFSYDLLARAVKEELENPSGDAFYSSLAAAIIVELNPEQFMRPFVLYLDRYETSLNRVQKRAAIGGAKMEGVQVVEDPESGTPNFRIGGSGAAAGPADGPP